MNILYIYGWGSNPEQSNTINYLRKNLPDDNIVSIEYDQYDPIGSIEFFEKFIAENDINAVIASSFGAFIAINIRHSVWKFLINPCLLPSIELPKLQDIDDKFISNCKAIEDYLFNKRIIDDEDMRFTVGFFATDDELFSYKEAYIKLGHHRCIELPNQGHRLDKDGLKIVVDGFKAAGVNKGSIDPFPAHIFDD
jgi:predicted esterase YcpF (UPF0227 family)